MDTSINASYGTTAKHDNDIARTPSNRNQSAEKAEFHDLVQPHLRDYCPASNLAFNEKVKRMMSEGQEVYHFGFGQAPFPVVPGMVMGLREYASENAYLPVAG